MSYKNLEEAIRAAGNPVQIFDTDKILADFPDGHVIHVVRNPYSGYADTSKRPFPLGIKRYAWTWNLCQHMALTYRDKYPDRFHLVRFEDLVADPRQTMEGLLERLGLPMSDECLHPSFNAVKLEQVYPWGTIRVPTPEANLATANELSDAQKLKTELDTLRVELANAQRKGEYQRAGELAYGRIPELEKKLNSLHPADAARHLAARDGALA